MRRTVTKPWLILLSTTLPLGCTDNAQDSSIERLESVQALLAENTTLDRLPAVPPGPDPADPRVVLGRELFADPRLSHDNTVSCKTCHVIGEGGDDGKPTAIGIAGQVGPINTPTVLNSALNFAQFWDGRADGLEDQVPGPIHNPTEMGSNWNEVIDKLSRDTAFVARFVATYPDGLTTEAIVDAIATYERALVTKDSPFDRFQRGEEGAISAEAQQGYQLFLGLGCVSCHQGANVGGNMFQRFGVMGDYFADRGNPTEADLGRYRVTGRERDKYVFKVPSLRSVATTGPYFHDGSAATLEEAVDVMIEYQLGRTVTDEERRAIVEFLLSLQGTLEERLL